MSKVKVTRKECNEYLVRGNAYLDSIESKLDSLEEVEVVEIENIINCLHDLKLEGFAIRRGADGRWTSIIDALNSSILRMETIVDGLKVVVARRKEETSGGPIEQVHLTTNESFAAVPTPAEPYTIVVHPVRLKIPTDVVTISLMLNRNGSDFQWCLVFNSMENGSAYFWLDRRRVDELYQLADIFGHMAKHITDYKLAYTGLINLPTEMGDLEAAIVRQSRIEISLDNQTLFGTPSGVMAAYFASAASAEIRRMIPTLEELQNRPLKEMEDAQIVDMVEILFNSRGYSPQRGEPVEPTEDYFREGRSNFVGTLRGLRRQ